jgi:hypothetical protein
VTSEISALPSWVRTAPFDLPVVPDVYISAQMSSGRTSTPGSAGGAALMIASYSR